MTQFFVEILAQRRTYRFEGGDASRDDRQDEVGGRSYPREAREIDGRVWALDAVVEGVVGDVDRQQE